MLCINLTPTKELEIFKNLINKDSYKNITDKVEKKDLFADEVRAVKTEVTDLFKSEANPFYNDIMQRAKNLL